MVVLSAWVAPRVSAITRDDATSEKFFLEPTMFRNNETWSGVGRIPGGPGTGALISPCHVLTAAHVFYNSDGKPKFPGYKPDPENYSFELVTGQPKIVERKLDDGTTLPSLDRSGLTTREFKAAKDGIKINPAYRPELGHRIGALPKNPKKADLIRSDIAILVLAQRVPAKLGGVAIDTYTINRGEIDKENDPNLTTPGDAKALPPPAVKPTANAVKVGFGAPGNGKGIVGGGGDGLKREMFNLVDDFGTGKTTFNVAKPAGTTFDFTNDKSIHNNPPPLNTIVYDFDAPASAGKGNNSSDLLNTFGGLPGEQSYSVGTLEGSASGGDSGGPMFQYKDGKKYITGVTSSGSDPRSRYGNVGYDTQVRLYKDWIDQVVKDNPCPEAKPDDDGGEPEQEQAGSIETTLRDGTVQSDFMSSTDVYLIGGLNDDQVGLPDGTYYFQVTSRFGHTSLSTDIAVCRQLVVSGGRVAGATGPPCKHANGSFNAASGTLPVQLFPFRPPMGNEFTAWLIAERAASISARDPRVLLFDAADARTAHFTVLQPTTPPPPGSCQASSSLTVLVSGTNVVGYVPKGNWSLTPTTGVSVVNIEGSGVSPTRISTPQVVNACASNPLTGQTVCTANTTDVYLLSGTALSGALTSGGSGSVAFSGGTCTNCGVSIDAIHNKAVIGLSVAGAPGFQFLDLGTSSFQPAFVSPARQISEAPVLDPSRNLLLSASENNNYEIINVANSTSPVFYEKSGIASGGELDSSAEECTTGIALAPAEFTQPSAVFLADLTQAQSTAGSPAGTWSAPSQVQSLSESFLAAGPTGIAVAQGTHTGVLSGEFGGDAVTAIALPPTSGSGTPAIGDWVTCRIGNGFSNGFDPHTVTAYQSPNTGDAIAALANGGATTLAVLDLTKMLDTTVVPRTAGGHACAAGTLPSAVVSFVNVP